LRTSLLKLNRPHSLILIKAECPCRAHAACRLNPVKPPMSTDRTNGFSGRKVSGPSRLFRHRRLLQAGEPAHLSRPERARELARAVLQARKALVVELEQRCRVAAAAA
jgi:hypothetical protein